MESHNIATELPITIKSSEDVKCKTVLDFNNQDAQMTSSITSRTSSLTSPVDSGVQLLDSESEITSLMSISGITNDMESNSNFDNDDISKHNDLLKSSTTKIINKEKPTTSINEKQNIEVSESTKLDDSISEKDIQISKIAEDTNVNKHINRTKNCDEPKYHENSFTVANNSGDTINSAAVVSTHNKSKFHIMTTSDIDNHNIHQLDLNISAAVLPVSLTATPSNSINFENKIDFKYNHQVKQNFQLEEKLNKDMFELEPVLVSDDSIKKSDNNDDLMNISLNSYELLDYTFHNIKLQDNITAGDDMHVSMSEEVNESLRLSTPIETPKQVTDVPIDKINSSTDDQIVFRRQRRKKSKSDTPKKRVSFHEDILNSTKIDDVHINHGFITHEPDISMSFFERGFSRKPDVVKGRYSWAAEGDSPYYQKNSTERQIKSDIYVHHARFSSTSSSSSASISSSVDEEDTGNSNSDDAFVKKEPTLKLPKSSCLKKTKSNKKYIDTNIVQEEINIKRKKSESNLLDTNIFGSLKNIFSFSTSVPLAERGVPEGQEDVSVYSTSDTGVQHKFKIISTNDSTAAVKNYEGFEVQPENIKKIGNLNLELAKTNLKLTRSEGFYPNYPNNQVLPNNIIMCDSNVYEHRGISYSYEYEKFQKTFEQQNKPKSSTVYQTLLNELNFFKRKEKKAIEKESKESFEILSASTPTQEQQLDDIEDDHSLSVSSLKNYSSSAIIDFSDNETLYDYNDVSRTRHLNSPKKKNKRPNHYSIQSLNSDDKSDFDFQLSSARSLQHIRPSSSKTSLINRFLKNVTLKKIIDLKLQKKQKNYRKYMKLYVTGIKANADMSKVLDREIEKEILFAKEKKIMQDEQCSTQLLYRFKNDIFRNCLEDLIRIFPVYSAYTTSGENSPLMVLLSNSTLYITGFKQNNMYCNYFVLPYTELNTIIIGPNSQTIHFSNCDKDMQCIVTTGSENLTNELIGQLEMAMRNDINKPKLAAVKQLTMHDMVNLRKAICKQTSISQDEGYFHYSIINIQDYNSDICETPLGPSKEGPLMFKTENDSRWETAYFILKAGILYMLSSPSHRLPMRVLPLINGACQGARRVYNITRPHTFQIQIGATTLLLAAPDEYVASEWLQVLVHAASKTYSHREKTPVQACSLLMTSEHILTVREAFSCSFNSSLSLRDLHQPIKGAQALSCASIADITAFRLPCAEQSWCILEFACREVHESSGDWILYFTTNSELEKFISTLEMLWAYQNENGDSFPLSTIPETEILSKKCVDIYNIIQNTWLSLHLNLQAF